MWIQNVTQLLYMLTFYTIRNENYHVDHKKSENIVPQNDRYLKAAHLSGMSVFVTLNH